MFSLDEYNAARHEAGIMDRSSRVPIGVSGRDRASFLQGLLTNDIQALVPGTGCYAAYLTPQGRMISDMRVLELGDLILLDVPRGLKDGLLARLDEVIFTEDVHLQDLADAWRQIGIHGPRAAAVLSKAIGEAGPPSSALATWLEHRNVRLTGSAADVEVDVVVASRAFGQPGFDAFVAGERLDSFRERLRAAGARDIGDDTVEVLRVEAGRPEFGVDMHEDTIPLEAGLDDRAISFTKGCYVGQEVIIRILHRGHGRVARKLVGLVVDAAPEQQNVPPRGAVLIAADQPVGQITSAVVSPAKGKPIALGYVKRELAEPAKVVQVQWDERRLPAVVTETPFVSTGT